MLLLGGQVLLGFSYRICFEEGFHLIPQSARLAEVGELGIMTAGLGWLIWPAAFHQIAEHGDPTFACQSKTMGVDPAWPYCTMASDLVFRHAARSEIKRQLFNLAERHVVNKGHQLTRITAKRLLIEGTEWSLQAWFFQNLISRARDKAITVSGNGHDDYALFFLVSTTNLPRDRAGIVEFQIDADEEPLRVNVQFPSLS
jgi:hypothetical protein